MTGNADALWSPLRQLTCWIPRLARPPSRDRPIAEDSRRLGFSLMSTVPDLDDGPRRTDGEGYPALVSSGQTKTMTLGLLALRVRTATLDCSPNRHHPRCALRGRHSAPRRRLVRTRTRGLVCRSSLAERFERLEETRQICLQCGARHAPTKGGLQLARQLLPAADQHTPTTGSSRRWRRKTLHLVANSHACTCSPPPRRSVHKLDVSPRMRPKNGSRHDRQDHPRHDHPLPTRRVVAQLRVREVSAVAVEVMPIGDRSRTPPRSGNDRPALTQLGHDRTGRPDAPGPPYLQHVTQAMPWTQGLSPALRARLAQCGRWCRSQIFRSRSHRVACFEARHLRHVSARHRLRLHLGSTPRTLELRASTARR